MLPPASVGWVSEPSQLGEVGSVIRSPGMKDREVRPHMLCELSPVWACVSPRDLSHSEDHGNTYNTSVFSPPLSASLKIRRSRWLKHWVQGA